LAWLSELLPSPARVRRLPSDRWSSGFLLLDTLWVGRPDMFWDAIKHMIAALRSHRFSPTMHRAAALPT